jgi:hypothetical protein
MKIASVVARVLLGLMFTLSGAMGFFLIFGHMKMPAPPAGLATDFNRVLFASHYVLVVDAFQLLCGVLLLANRYVPLALTILAAILVNIVAFHVTMAPAGIVPGLVAWALWALVARQHWGAFAPLFVAKRYETGTRSTS